MNTYAKEGEGVSGLAIVRQHRQYRHVPGARIVSPFYIQARSVRPWNTQRSVREHAWHGNVVRKLRGGPPGGQEKKVRSHSGGIGYPDCPGNEFPLTSEPVPMSPGAA